MSATLNYAETIVIEHCCRCGIAFGMPAEFDSARRRDGGQFYCPSGHVQCYLETEATQLKRQLAVKQTEIERKQAEIDRKAATIQRLSDESATAERRLSAARGQITKIKNRVAKGVCPCCNRQFHDLHRHMTTEHPNYTAAE